MNTSPRIAVPALPEDTPNYIEALKALGAVPVNIDNPSHEGFDGLLLPGGADIDPSFYGRENAGSVNINSELDLLQFAAAKSFISANKPVFGICKGQQLLNVLFGGTLIQHLDTASAHMQTAPGCDNVHLTTLKDNSFLSTLYPTDLAVNSSHHQAVEILAPVMRAVQFASDGTIEAIQHKSLPIFAVQWHPERMCFSHARKDTVDGSSVIKYFLSLCK